MPKQVDIVDMANSAHIAKKNLSRSLELDTLGTSTWPMSPSSQTQIFSNIEIDRILMCGKQDTGAEINAMPLDVYDQLNQKLKGKLKLRSCNDVKVIGYSKHSVNIVGKISVTCTHATTIKKCVFYVMDIVDTKVILGLQFCRAFNLVTVNCNDQFECKKVAIDVVNSEFLQGLDPGNLCNTIYITLN